MITYLRTGLMVAVLAALSLAGHAQDWGALTAVSATMGVNANRLCVGEASRGDLGCPTYAPSLTTAGDVSVTGNLSAARFIGDGSGLTGVGGSATVPTGLSGSLVFRDENGYLQARSSLSVSSTTGSVGIGFAAGAALGSNALYANGHIQTANNFYGNNLLVATTGGMLWGSGNSITGDPTNKFITFTTSTTEAMRIVSTGYVGIGTSAPSSTLHVYSPTSNNNMFRVGTATQSLNLNATNLFSSGGALSLNNGSSAHVQILPGSVSARVGIRLAAESIVPSQTLHVSGTLLTTSWTGINFSSAANVTPTTPLEVSGTISATAFVGDGSALTGIPPGQVTTGASGSLVYRDGTGNLLASVGLSISSTTGSVGIGAGAPSWITNGLYATGSIGTNGALYVAGGVVMNAAGASSILWNGSTNNRISGDATNQYLALTTSGTEALRIVSTGYVGIGTNAPATKLEVAGTVSATGVVAVGGLVAGGAGYTGSLRLYSSSGGLITSLGTSSGYFGAGSGVTLGFGTASPSSTIHVSGTARISSWTTVASNVTPTGALDVYGTVSATVLQLADSPATACGPGTYGTIKIVNGRQYTCRP